MHKNLLALSLFFLTLCLIVPAKTVYAHDASLTYTTINASHNKLDVTMITPANNILTIYPEKDKKIEDIDLAFFSKIFEKGFVVENDGDTCHPQLKNAHTKSEVKGVAYTFQFVCKKALGNFTIKYNLFFDVSPTHENITDVQIGDEVQHHIFSIQKPTLTIDTRQLQADKTNEQLAENIISFLKLGVEHIFGGIDHILFLLGLLLVTTRFKSLLKIITAFTVAHSITLIISALNIYVLPSRFTESMIALSISYVAFENLRIIKQNKKNRRWLIAFCFGLIHGFGFSSVLREIGLPHEGLIASLVSFNVGVEIGQLCIVSIMFPILLLIQKRTWHTIFIKSVSIIIGLIGIFWFVQRAFFS